MLAAMQARVDALPAGLASRRPFLETYRRTTVAVGSAIERGYFEDPAWVEAWDAVFADLYLDALDADLAGSAGVPRPWRLAFDAPPSTCRLSGRSCWASTRTSTTTCRRRCWP